MPTMNHDDWLADVLAERAGLLDRLFDDGELPPEDKAQLEHLNSMIDKSFTEEKRR